MAPAMAGPAAPPISGASEIKLIAVPRFSETNMSPTIAGLSTLLATATPVRARAKMSTVVVGLMAERTVNAVKSTLAMLTTG